MNGTWLSFRRIQYALVGAVLLPCAVLTGFGVLEKYHQDEQAAAVESYNLARITADNVSTFLVEAHHVLEVLAKRPQMQLEGCDPIFTDFKDFFPRLSNLSRSTLSGYLDCSSLPQAGGKALYVGEMEWFQQVLKNRQFTVGPIVFGPINKGWITVLAQPIVDASNNMVGAVQTPIDLLKLRLTPTADRLRRGTLVTIIDGQGRVVARSENPEKFVGRSIRELSMVNIVLSRPSGTLRMNGADGIERIFGFFPVAGTDWKVIVGILSSIALEKARTNAQISGIAGLAIFGAAILLGLYIAGRISRPVSAVRDSVLKVAAGDITARAPVNGPLEIREVAKQFNRMLDVIVESQAAVQSSENRLQLALTGSRLALWEADLLATTLTLTLTWCELIHDVHEQPEYRFNDFYRQVFIEDRRGLRTSLISILRGEAENLIIEFRFPTRTGELKVFSSEGRVSMRSADGKALRMVGTTRDISERRASEKAIQKLAYYDALTDLPNRRHFMDRLRRVNTITAGVQYQHALLFIDLDNFKQINDGLGHAQGDFLLQEVTHRLKSCIRQSDMLARLGGDEFVALLEGLDQDRELALKQAETIGEAMRAELTRQYHLNNEDHRVTASIGISLLNPASDISGEEVLKEADTAMFHAKASGRNTLRVFDPAMSARVQARNKLEAELRVALTSQQFILHYQPQVDRNGLLIGAEALIRWISPGRGMVSPAQFIPIAEETGLILPLGLWVLEEACEVLKTWQDVENRRDITIAVNVSARQVRHETFVDDFLRILERAGAPASRLKLELTEGLLVENVEETIGKMTQLRSHGVTFSIDDFGTGFSSLSYLKRLPLSQLKIDQSFVRDILTDPNDAAIAKMVTTLANSLGLQVIAEGVETIEQRNMLALQGCNHYQGYFFGRPVPIHEFDRIDILSKLPQSSF